ncbi:DUF4192 family protein [Streptomyces sp. NPDC056373]|uniref:DUF4192 family protein n=1 Tax=Streptomyces sp. NPDC056373 TaxID=3345798 RepID=UPI0035D58CBF
MTNHSETTGSPENGDITGPGTQSGHRNSKQENKGNEPSAPNTAGPPYAGHGGEHQVTLRTPAELADALPYLLGYRPEDSIVLVALHDSNGRGRFGGRARLGIPASPDDWPSAARQLSHGLVTGSERRRGRPESMVAFLCQEPGKGETGRQVMERLRPLAQRLRVECGSLDVVVVEALCISEGRYWSYCCDNEACCSSEGAPMGLPGTSVLAAAATYAGIQVRGTLRELRARLLPWENAAALEQEAALDTASMALVPKILDDAGRATVADETLELAGRILDRFAEAQPVSGMLLADLRDDELLGHDEAARLILGLQDRATRDRAAAWMEGDEAARALRLWRTLARRCVGPYSEHAAAPLTLAGWVAWSAGDELEAREALAMALGADPDYLFARLLHQACNEGLDPESIRRCLRAEREGRGRAAADLEPHAESSESAGRDTKAAPEIQPHGTTSSAAAPRLGPPGNSSPTTVRPESEQHEKPAQPAAPSRRRRRTRTSGATGSACGGTRADDRDGAVRTPGRRTPAGTTRPAGPARSAAATRPAATRSVGATETGARPGRVTAPGTARPGDARTGNSPSHAPKKTATPDRNRGEEGVQTDQGLSGEE